MHTILHLQTDRSDTQNHQPLEQRLRQTRFSCFLTHDHRTQLTVIAHQNQLSNTADGTLTKHISLYTNTTIKSTSTKIIQFTIRCGQHNERLLNDSVSYLFGPEHHWHHALGLCGLGALIDENGAELHLRQSRITGPHTCATDHICVLRKSTRENCCRVPCMVIMWWDYGSFEQNNILLL